MTESQIDAIKTMIFQLRRAHDAGGCHVDARRESVDVGPYGGLDGRTANALIRAGIAVESQHVAVPGGEPVQGRYIRFPMLHEDTR